MNHAIKRKPEPCLLPIKVYCDEDQRATLESHCAAQGVSLSGFLRREGLRVVTAHQQINRRVVHEQGPVAGLRRAFAFPGVRRAARSVQRPMRS
jgi:hypothetical protein